jgi:restriction endonuclease
MKLKFKVQLYQTSAVESVVDCFAGQMNSSGIGYRIDPDYQKSKAGHIQPELYEQTGFKNTDIHLTDVQILTNIHTVQRRQNLPLSDKLVMSAGCKINLDVEMETGTGKTYCYIKTIFEMNKRYGWSKFIVVVPSIAIREGVYKSLEITADHFAESYGRKARFFIYNSKLLPHLENFSSDAGINVMVINIQAFNATGKDNRRIYDELDDFQSRRPIDVISSNRPIVILDEPQKMEGAKTLDALSKFKPLMILRYSATHRTTHNKVHRLDALDAYNQKLVKKISVFSEFQLPDVGDDRKPKTNPLNTNFEKKEFRELWKRINRKAVYRVAFDSTELIRNSIRALDKELKVNPLQYTIQGGEQVDQTTYDQLRAGQGFEVRETTTKKLNASIHSIVRYDLLGKLAENTQLTRKTIAEMMCAIQPVIFNQFKQNPEHFLAEATRLINEQKATIIIEHLSYDEIAAQHDIDIFTAGQSSQDFSKASGKLRNHIYDPDCRAEPPVVRYSVPRRIQAPGASPAGNST